MIQGIGQPNWIRDVELVRAEVDGAIRAALDRDFGIAERNRTQRSWAAAR